MLNPPARVSLVRWHLLPYLGGDFGIQSLRTDSVSDSNCTACTTDAGAADGLAQLRATVPLPQRVRYDAASVCYMQLTDALVGGIPKDPSGVFLVPRRPPTSPFSQSLALLHGVFARGCDLEGCAAADFSRCHEPSGTAAAPGVPAGEQVGCSPAASNASDPQSLPVCGVGGGAPWVDVCDGKDHGFADPTEASVFCYFASFLQKMLLELTVSPPLGQNRKTEQHVRAHLTPYLGGNGTTAATATDSMDDANCTVCWSSAVCSVHQVMWVDTPCCYDTDLPGWGEGVCPENTLAFRRGRDAYFALRACYANLASYVMEALPKVGKWLVPPRRPDTPYTLTAKIVKGIFLRYGVDGCGGGKTTTNGNATDLSS